MVHPPFHLSVNDKNAKIFADDNPGSRTCYREVIVDDCYRILSYSKKNNPSVIVDIGANIGVFSKFCSLLFPQSVIHAYEPNPSAIKWLRHNSAETNIKVYPYAVAELSGLAKLKSGGESTTGYLTLDGDITVECVEPSKVAEGQTIDLLKIDCEGGEWSILKDSNLLKRTQFLCMEYHLYDEHCIDELTTLLESGCHQVLRVQPSVEYNNKFGLLWSKNRNYSASIINI